MSDETGRMAGSGDRAVVTNTERIPAWMIAIKVLLAVLLVTGALFSDVGGFAGKGMAYRLPIFLLPALIVPVRWWRPAAHTTSVSTWR